MTKEHRLRDEINTLRTLRDELRVQVNLGAKELRDRFRETEERWGEFERHLKSIEQTSRDAAHEVGDAGRTLLQEIRKAYDHIRAEL